MRSRKLTISFLGLALLLASLTTAYSQTATPPQKTTASGKQKASVQTEVAPPEKKTKPATQQEYLASFDIKAMNKVPLPEFRPQLPKRIELANGMVVFLQEDHELPLISAVAYIRGGSKEEPAQKIGLVSVYGGS